MNILYLCDEYPPGQHGGIGTSVCSLARTMARLGHSVVVAGLYSPGFGGQDFFTDQGVKVYRFRWRFDSKYFTSRGSVLFRVIQRLLKYTGLMEQDIKKSLARYHNELERIISEHKIDIVEMPDYNDYVRFTRSHIPLPKLSVPVVVKMNGSITYFAKEAGHTVAPHIFKTECGIIEQATAIAAVSKYTATKSAEYFGYANNIGIIPNGIETDIAPADHHKDPHLVVFTGSLVQKKGIYQLAKAWNKVIHKKPDARLLVLGKGPQQKVITLLSAKAKNTVSFKGHVDSRQLYQYLAKASIAVFPSYSEAFALASLEAMACGVAVINSERTSGTELIEDGVNGLLIDPDDPDQIAAAILLLLNDRSLVDALSANGQKKVKATFDIQKIATENIRFYINVVTKRPNYS